MDLNVKIKNIKRLLDIENMKVIDITEITNVNEIEYLAISYVWNQYIIELGDYVAEITGYNRNMWIKGELMFQIWTTARLYKLKYIWLDQICIDQISENDKKEQVPEMNFVYTLCKMCLVSLPDISVYDLEQLLTFGNSANSEFDFNEEMKYMHELINNFIKYEKALIELSKIKWIQRVWTLQECLLSKNHIIFFCKDGSIEQRKPVYHVWARFYIYCDINKIHQNVKPGLELLDMLNEDHAFADKFTLA